MAESDGQNDLRAKIMAIMRDTTLTDAEKAQKRQELMCGGSWSKPQDDDKRAEAKKDDVKTAARAGKPTSSKADLLEDTLKCVICFGLCERPVTGPCQHNFCLSCFKRWTAQGKKNCPTCRAAFPRNFIDNPRINTLLTHAIRCAKQGIKDDAPKTYNRIADDSRPAEAFTTERAVRNGRANAASGRIMVNVPGDWFGPILPEHDPTNGKGVQVGDWWKDRLDCRQWGAHFPHVAGIAGQSNRGAQSVVLSGGYEDDHDEGEWFLYTGSGGRDLSGNKRTNKEQSFDQTFDNMNQALKISCLRGLPVRVVRSYKEKRSSYAPPQDTPVRYDGIYRILRCWRKKGAQGFLMCRYLFVRCDNAPAPWTSDDSGDSLRLNIPDLAAKEIKEAQGQVFNMGDDPYWDYDEKAGTWGWAREQPPSGKTPGGGDTVKKLKKKASAHDRLLKEFSCALCKNVLNQPLSMPCGHNFCKECLDKRFAEADASTQGSKALQEAKPARTLRQRKVPRPCPTCKADIADYMAHAAVNTEMAELINRLKEAAEQARQQAEKEAQELKDEKSEGDAVEEGGDDTAAGEGGDDDDNDDDDQGQQQDDDKQVEEQGAETEPKVQGVADEQDSSQDKQAADANPVAAAPAAAATQPPTATADAPAAERYAAELSQLRESFPDYDEELIVGMLEDQGGDVLEVHAVLKRMKNQLAHAKRQAAKTAATTAGSDEEAPTAAASGSRKRGRGKGSKGGRVKKQTTEPAAAGETAAATVADEKQQHADGDYDNGNAAGAVGADEGGATADDEVVADAAADGKTDQERAVEGEQADIQQESDKCCNGAGPGKTAGKAAASQKLVPQGKAAAVAAAAPAEGAVAEEAAATGAATTAGKKRRHPASSTGEW